MVIHVKDEEADALVRKLARLRGVGITAAIKEAVSEAIEADSAGDAAKTAPLDEKLKPLLDRLDRLSGHEMPTGKAFFDHHWGEQE